MDRIRQAAREERWGEVETGLHRWLLEYPRDGNAWEMLGGLLFDQGRAQEARSALERVREGDQGWIHAQVVLGEIAVQEHNLPEAERIFRHAVDHDRTSAPALERLISLISLELRPAEARSLLRKLFKITHDPRHLADSILISRIESDLRDAGPEIEVYLQKTPGDPWLRRVWGLLLQARGRPADARPHLEAAAAALDDDPVGRFALAECRMQLGIPEDDFSILGAMPERAVDSARWWVFRSRLAASWGRSDEALKSLRAAVAADPRNSEAQFRLGQELLRLGDQAAAKSHLDRARSLGVVEDTLRRELRRLSRHSDDPGAYWRAGRLCQDAGMLVEARDWFSLAVQRDPYHKPLEFEWPAASPLSEEPVVALSRPVFKSSPVPILAKRAPGTTGRPGSGPHFDDIAERSGLRYRYECGATDNLFIGDTMGGGVALFDFDDDGWLDVYFVNGCHLPFDRQAPPGPNKLFRNRGDGTFEDVTLRAGVAGRGYGMGCAVGDFDNDGHDDLFLTGLSATVLYHNKGDGTFEDVTVKAGVSSARWTTAAGFGDLDGDGDLDLVVVTYVQAEPTDPLECRDKFDRLIHCQPERFPAQFDLLFRNNGNGTFTNVSREAGVELPDGKGLGLAIADFDGDGQLDLFVANDGTPNFLFRNCGRLRFEEVALVSGVAYDGSGQATASMGVVADDLNDDGLIDLFHTNFINQTNTLRWNEGGGRFVDRSLTANLAAPSRFKTGFGAVALDVDNDGTLDLFVANGHVDDQPWYNTPMAQRAQLFMGKKGGRFEIAEMEQSRYFSRAVVGRGVAAGDLDNDGRVDLVVVHRDTPAALLRNVTPGGHWLGLRLRGTKSSAGPIGARVVCRSGGRSRARFGTSGTSYLSSSDPRIWFGLGPNRKVDHLEVRWPSGGVQSWSDLPADCILEIQEGNNALHPAKPFQRSQKIGT